MQFTNPKTKVLFLLEAQSNTDVFAYFPNERYNSIEPDVFTSYAHIGQHSACHADYASKCKEATKSQYNDLYNELVCI